MWSAALRLVAVVAAALIGAASIGAAPAQTNRSRSFGPGACGPGDPAYVRLANETGGQPFFMSPAEIGKSAQVMTASGNESGLIVWATGSGADAASGFTIPVDGSIARLSMLATFDGTGGTMSAVAPDGAVVTAGARTQETVLNCGRVLTIESPARGAWRVQVSPSSRFWLVARGRSPVDLMRAEFVRLGGRPGHEGLFKIQGQPIAGQPAMLRVQLAEAPPKLPTVVLMSMRGQLIRRLSLTRVSGDELTGPIELPLEPFRVGIAGVDESGLSYQRLYAGLFHAEVVEVGPSGEPQPLRAGQETVVTFAVHNTGPRARYRIVAVDAKQFVTRVEPATVDLDSNAEQIVRIVLRVPPGTSSGTDIDLTVTATSDGPRPSSNGAVQRLTVGG